MSTRQAAGWAALGAGAMAGAFLLMAPPRQGAGSDAKAGTEKAAPDAPTSSASDGEVRVEPAEQKRIGVAVARATATSAPAIAHGFARGLDGANLAAIDSEITTASAAASASRAEAVRLATLASQDQSASVKAVQAARAQAAADSARVELAARRIGLEYGAGLARLGPAARRALVADIASGRAALVRVDVPGAALGQLNGVRIDGGGGSLRMLGPAASADARLQSAGMLAVLRGPVAASATNGRILGVTVESGGSQPGVMVPRAAVIRWRGGVWVYRRTGAETFQRVELVDARPTAGGWFVSAGMSAGDQVVVSGAGTLLAIDRGGGAAPDQD